MTTRSDAIVKILPDSCSSAMYDQAARLVDALVALGILKLDEPKTIEQRLDAAVRANLYAETAYSRDAVYIRPDYLMEVIARAGLRIVEK